MEMVTIDATTLRAGQQGKGSSLNTLQRRLGKLRGQSRPGTVMANGLENALIAGGQHPDKDVAAAIRHAVESLLEELDII
ncbi:MAG: hypothetical protein ABIL62_11055 [Planctomycetota bacterium]